MLEEVIAPMAFPCPVADTEEGPSIRWENYYLLLEFIDYKNSNCSLKFCGVHHFRLFAEVTNISAKYSDDGVCEIQNSHLTETLTACGVIGEKEKVNYRHIVIGFNEIGSFLEVVYEEMQIIRT